MIRIALELNPKRFLLFVQLLNSTKTLRYHFKILIINTLILSSYLYKFIFVFSLKQNDIFKVKLSSFLLLFIT